MFLEKKQKKVLNTPSLSFILYKMSTHGKNILLLLIQRIYDDYIKEARYVHTEEIPLGFLRFLLYHSFCFYDAVHMALCGRAYRKGTHR